MNLGAGSKKIKNEKNIKKITITDQSLPTLEGSVSRIYHDHYNY
jgi:hypothetical protein